MKVALVFPLLILGAMPAQGQDSAVAIVRAYEQANLSASISATITAVRVALGDRVAKGDEIVTFDCDALEAEKEVLVVEMQGAEIERDVHAFAVSNQTGSKIELRRAENKFEMAKMRVNAHNSQLGKCAINAPFGGVVSDVFVNSFERVAEGTPIIVLTNTQTAYIESRIPAFWLQHIDDQTQFVFNAETSSSEVGLRINRISATIDEVSQTVKVEGRITSDEKNVQIGQTGVIYISKTD